MIAEKKRITKESFQKFLEGQDWYKLDVFINKESQRIRKESLNALDGKDVLLVFPTNHKKNSTVRILKTPKIGRAHV